MKNSRPVFALITVCAIALALYAGWFLKTQANQLEKAPLLGWGFILTAAALTAVRGIRYLLAPR
jgi:hypothetical protein